MSAQGDLHASTNRKTVWILTGIAVAMLVLGFSFKPLYDTFCRVTGFGGTTQVGDVKSDTMLDREILVRFDANVNPALNWAFKPKTPSVSVNIGQNVLAFYTAKNLSDTPVVGTASYNVMPVKAAPYFTKIECFCFTEQLLKPGEEVVMPVLFFVNPEIADSERHKDVETITLSYTFHKVDSPRSDAIQTEERQATLERLSAEILTD